MSDRPDFAVLHPAGHISYEHRQAGETLNAAVRRHLQTGRPGMGTMGHGPLRLWYHDLFTPELPSNRLAITSPASLATALPTVGPGR
jgi:hypothetical protein